VPPTKRAPRPRRRPNYRLVKIHRNYTVDEAAKNLGVVEETIRRWLKSGKLPAITDKIPTLILGGDLFDFLQARSAKRPKLPAHQCYCFKCRGPRAPALGMADYIPRTPTTGTLRALCETCLTVMNKVVSALTIAELEAVVELSIKQAEQHLVDTSSPCLNAVWLLHGTQSNPQDAGRGSQARRHHIKLPSGVFRPYAGVSTAIVIFTKTNSGGTDHVWFYDVRADGLSLDDKRQALVSADKFGPVPSQPLVADEHEKNNLPDLVGRWNERSGRERERPRTTQSFAVPKAEIALADYDLSINRYKEVVHSPVEHRVPKAIIAELRTLETEIARGLDELEAML
jgi:hypothetical protein